MNIGELTMPARLVEDARRGAVFYISHSGGKDSQAMYALLNNVLPHDQICVIHADLGEVEWHGVQDHIRASIDHPLNVVKAVYKDGRPKTLLNYVEHRFQVRPTAPSWPSAASRWCTSELKTGPIRKFIRNDMKRRGASVAVNCIGIRAEESAARAKKLSCQLNQELSKAGRKVWDWMPVFRYTTNEVFQTIEHFNQKPFWAYAEGNERLSCVFCILGSDNDLKNGYRYRPELAAKYIALQEKTGWKMFHKSSLENRINLIPVREVV